MGLLHAAESLDGSRPGSVIAMANGILQHHGSKGGALLSSAASTAERSMSGAAGMEREGVVVEQGALAEAAMTKPELRTKEQVGHSGMISPLLTTIHKHQIQ